MRTLVGARVRSLASLCVVGSWQRRPFSPDDFAQLVLGAQRTKEKSTSFELPPAGTSVPGEETLSRIAGLPPPLYRCNQCEHALFSLEPKLASSTSTVGQHLLGWPSFARPIRVDAVTVAAQASVGSIKVRDDKASAEAEAAFGQAGVLSRPSAGFRVDQQTAVNAVAIPVDSPNEIRRFTMNIPTNSKGMGDVKRTLDNKIKVSKRLWQSSRGNASQSERCFIGHCSKCKESVCFVTFPSGSSPAYIVSAEKVHCVPADDDVDSD